MLHKLKRARWFGDESKIEFLRKFIETDIFQEAVELALIEEEEEQDRLVDLNQVAGPVIERQYASRKGAISLLKRLEKLSRPLSPNALPEEFDAWDHLTETVEPQNLTN